MPQGERSRSEPEIIPPNRTHRGAKSRERVFTETRDTERVYVARVRPLGVVLAIFITCILAAAMLALLIATFLIWAPLLILLAGGAVIVAFLRLFFQRAP